jgi:ammonium transporter, Amt family
VKLSHLLLCLLCWAVTTLGCYADEPDARALALKAQTNATYVWVLISSVLVIFMKTGFALLELGCTRAKNAINIIMKNFLDFCGVAVAFLFVGFPLMFGDSFHGWLGISGFHLWQSDGKSPLWLFWLFQVGFAGVTVTIVSGAIAERTKFLAYVIYAFIFAILIYPVYGHWAWGGAWNAFANGVATPEQMGWLQRWGLKDFAGGSVVHGIGGASALAAVVVVGPRVNRFDAQGNGNIIPGHNLPFMALGTFILWIGWYGFNAGSTLVAGVEIGRIAVSTTLAPCVGALIAMISVWKTQGRPDLGMSLNGALAGLVAITPACANVSVGSSLIIGGVAGLLCTYSSVWMEKMRIDDAVGAVPVHLVNGTWGILATEIFDETGFQLAEFGVQCTAAVVAPLFGFGMTYIIFKIMQSTIGVRATDIEQSEGLDFHEHAANAYPDFYTAGE